MFNIESLLQAIEGEGRSPPGLSAQEGTAVSRTEGDKPHRCQATVQFLGGREEPGLRGPLYAVWPLCLEALKIFFSFESDSLPRIFLRVGYSGLMFPGTSFIV